MKPGTPGRSGGRLRGATVLVTGAARGLGAAATRALAAEGARCFLVDVRREELTRLGMELGMEVAGGDPSTGRVIGADLADPAHLRGAVATVTAAARGDLTAFVHCAGVLPEAPIEATGDEDWERTLAVNLTSAFFLIREFAPLLAANGGGSVVLTSSRAGVRGFAGEAAYCASKFGLEGLSQALAAEWQGSGVSANTITPGARIKPTGMTTEAEARLPAAERSWGSADPLGPAFPALALLRGSPTGRRFRADRVAAAVRAHGLPLPESAWDTLPE